MPSPPISRRRNFCIIAHIDHGKSTLADRLIEKTGGLSAREMRDQVLDSMDLERERGITIKAHSVRLQYTARDGLAYEFNLIDTPGHVDFHYEVSRSLAACEGAILVVDASQGVEAQTVANAYLAVDHHLTIVPVINKIDLPNADLGACSRQIADLLGSGSGEPLRISAKTGEGVDHLLEAIVAQVPPPKGDEKNPARALVFDSWFDSYQGVVVLVRVFEGKLSRGQRIRLVHTEKEFEILQLGAYTPRPTSLPHLSAGEVGFVACGIKQITDARMGDTLVDAEAGDRKPLAGFRVVQPMVFCGLYPVDATHYELLKESLEKLALNDSAFRYEPETSQALGFGFRCGFLGFLHMEIVQERLEREYGLRLISASPTTALKIHLTDGTHFMIDNPAKLPVLSKIARMEEPFVLGTLHVPAEFVGAVLALCEERRGIQKKIDYPSQGRVLIQYELPFQEIMFDFHDRLKSMTRGYASIEYEFIEYRESDLVKLNILINAAPVDALSVIVHRDKAYERGRQLTAKLKEVIPRQQYEVAIQAAIGVKVVARETVKALRKDVTAKCYGGDITRKRKLLEKQKEGKKRMKRLGQVEIPQEAFLAVLKID